MGSPAPITDDSEGAGVGAVLGHTTSLCSRCKRSVPAELRREGDRVVMHKRCDAHGTEAVLISSNAAWYLDTLAAAPTLTPPPGAHPVAQGCPFDCGPCTAHEQRNHLPVVAITSKCDLDCPICYTHNKNEGAYHMGEEELGAILRHLATSAPDRRIINLTGGEPTQHPDLERVIQQCHDAGIRRVTLSTHGLRFLKNEALAVLMARLDARVILSFDSFTEDGNKQLLGGNHLGAKLRILEVLERHGVNTTLLPVLARGVNDHEVGAFIDLALEKDFIRSVELHPMTFTGQSGASFERSARYTTYDVLCDIERHSGGRLRVSDFVPAPVAHPLCYQVTYLLRLDDGRWLPFPRFMPRPELRGLLAEALYMVPGPTMEKILEDVINRLWAGDIACDDSDAVLGVLKRLVGRLFAPGLTEAQRLAIAEADTKAIYVHTHMDEESFDSDRIRQCCVGMPGPDGSSIPSCAYNVLYRERDGRFIPEPREKLVTLGLGRRS